MTLQMTGTTSRDARGRFRGRRCDQRAVASPTGAPSRSNEQGGGRGAAAAARAAGPFWDMIQRRAAVRPERPQTPAPAAAGARPG